MKIEQEEIGEVVKLLEHLKYMEAVRYSAHSRLYESDFEARISSSNNQDYSFSGQDVRDFIEKHIDDDIKETMEKLAAYGVTVKDED